MKLLYFLLFFAIPGLKTFAQESHAFAEVNFSAIAYNPLYGKSRLINPGFGLVLNRDLSSNISLEFAYFNSNVKETRDELSRKSFIHWASVRIGFGPSRDTWSLKALVGYAFSDKDNGFEAGLRFRRKLTQDFSLNLTSIARISSNAESGPHNEFTPIMYINFAVLSQIGIAYTFRD